MNRESIASFLNLVGIVFCVIAISIFITPFTIPLIDWIVRCFINHRVESTCVVLTIGLAMLAAGYLLKRARIRRTT